MFLIKDILTNRYVAGITRWQGSPLVNIRDITRAKQYNSHEEAFEVIKKYLGTHNGFEVVTQ